MRVGKITEAKGQPKFGATDDEPKAAVKQVSSTE